VSFQSKGRANQKKLSFSANGILAKLGKLNSQEAILVVLLSMLLSMSNLALVSLIQLFALPFMLVLTSFALLALWLLPRIRNQEDIAIKKTRKVEKVSPYCAENYHKQRKRNIQRAEILKFVFFNPNSSVSQIAGYYHWREGTIRMLVDDLVEHSLFITYRQKSEDYFSVNDQNSSTVVDILRKLKSLERQLKNFN